MWSFLKNYSWIMAVDYVISAYLLVEWLSFKMHCNTMKWLFYAIIDIWGLISLGKHMLLQLVL